MINEPRGTPDIIREIVNENSKSINSIISNEIDDSLNLEISKSSHPDEMNSIINSDRIKSPVPVSGIKNSAPVFQNIGGVKDFKSF